MTTNFRTPPSPPFAKEGLGGFPGKFSHTPYSLFGSGQAGLGKMRINILASWALMVFLLSAPSFSWARGGGGCLAEGTPVLTPEGPIPIEKLRVGDGVVTIAGGKADFGRVLTRMAVESETFLEIAIPEAKLRLTPEHPVMVGRGSYLLAKLLKPGHEIYTLQHGRLAATAIQSIRSRLERKPVYNLLVAPGGTFTAAGIVVHNKGCFLPDSPILKGDGTEVPIRALRPGDQVLAFTAEGQMVRTTVRNIVRREVEAFVALQTDRQTLRVTAEHPFYVGRGLFKTLEGLKVGDIIYTWDGQGLAQQPIVRLETIRERTIVYNLQTDLPHTFFASRLAVHNKGGGGCFPAGTLIRTPQGQIPIETLAPGNPVLAMDPEKRIVRPQPFRQQPEQRVAVAAEVPAELPRGSNRNHCLHWGVNDSGYHLLHHQAKECRKE